MTTDVRPLGADLFDYDESSNTYSQELSLLARKPAAAALFGAGVPGELVLADSDLLHRFVLEFVDRSGGDVAGWRFRETECGVCEWSRPHRPATLLIVND